MILTSAFLGRYGRVLGIAAGVGGLLALYTYRIDQAEQRGYHRATADMATRVSEANAATAALEQRQRAQTQQAAQAWESQRNELQSRIDSITARKPVVRLCKPAASAAPVRIAAEPAGSFDDPAGGRIDAVPSQPDIGPELVRFGAQCEFYRQQLGALQDWIRSTR